PGLWLRADNVLQWLFLFKFLRVRIDLLVLTAKGNYQYRSSTVPVMQPWFHFELQ
ncbi:hypothetical protein Goari_007894, partial [Gossypium aridum]|nr:hypothetical protein [Gossypium aridum]